MNEILLKAHFTSCQKDFGIPQVKRMILCPTCKKEASIVAICTRCNQSFYTTERSIGCIFPCPTCEQEMVCNVLQSMDETPIVVSRSGRIEPLDFMSAVSLMRDEISRHDEDRIRKGVSLNATKASLFQKPETYRSEVRETASSKREFLDIIAKIRKRRAANQHRKPRKFILSLCEKLILREWAYLDDLPGELANTVANIYYRYCEVAVLIKATKKRDLAWADALRELGIDRIEENAASPVPRVFRAYQAHVLSEYKAINEMINALRQTDRNRNPDDYKLAVEFALLSMKYNVDLSPLKKQDIASIKKQVDEGVVDEIPGLIDLLNL